jgi:hypothetical protein
MFLKTVFHFVPHNQDLSQRFSGPELLARLSSTSIQDVRQPVRISHSRHSLVLLCTNAINNAPARREGVYTHFRHKNKFVLVLLSSRFTSSRCRTSWKTAPRTEEPPQRRAVKYMSGSKKSK